MEERGPRTETNTPGDARSSSPKNTKVYSAPAGRKAQEQLNPNRHTKKFAPPPQPPRREVRPVGAAAPIPPVSEEKKAAEKKKKLMMIIFIVTGAVLAIAVGLILFFVLRDKPESEEPDEPIESTSPIEESEPPEKPQETPETPVSSNGLPMLGDREVTSAEMVKKGDVLTFGTYEQDGNTDNGREPLKWRVLRKDDTKLLLITDQVVDSMAFTTVKNAERWKNSSLRAWLNDAFYDRTFSSLEKKLILEQKVEDTGNSFHGVPEGDTTWDRVFLLDITDTANLFASDEERIAVPTQYALLQGALTEKGFCGWWLRNPGMHTSLAAFVAADGSVYRAGDSIGRDGVGVRPVIWIEIPAA